mgnify:CR=1 FL=1
METFAWYVWVETFGGNVWATLAGFVGVLSATTVLTGSIEAVARAVLDIVPCCL